MRRRRRTLEAGAAQGCDGPNLAPRRQQAADKCAGAEPSDSGGKRGASGRGRRKRRAPRPTGRSGPRPAWPAPASRRARAGDAGGSSGPAGPLGARTPPARRPRCPKGAVRAGGGGVEDLPLGQAAEIMKLRLAAGSRRAVSEQALVMRALRGCNGVTQWARCPAPGRVAPSQGRPGRVASQAVGSARCCSCAKP